MKHMKKLIVYIIALIIFTGVFMILEKEDNKEYNFNIYFFSAGKADAILVENNNKYIMIDTGEKSLSNEILNYFKNHNITKLDYLIITHFDKDHVGSASTIIDNIDIDEILQSNYPKDSEYYNNYLSSINDKNITPITVSGDKKISIEDLNIVVNGPSKLYDKDKSNNSSLIVSIKYKNTNYLFMGDAENERIKDFIKINNNTYNFIKIPYHGHYQKQLDNLINNTKPKYAIITSSLEKLEDEKTIALLNRNNIKYYLTRKGAINIYSDGDTIKIEQ